jgi:hypothetical protein
MTDQPSEFAIALERAEVEVLAKIEMDMGKLRYEFCADHAGTNLLINVAAAHRVAS